MIGFIFGMIIFFGMVYLFIGLPKFISRKYFGVNFHSRFNTGTAYRIQEMNASRYNFYVKNRPDIIAKSITQCERKGYKKTIQNILDEIDKIERNEKLKPGITTNNEQNILEKNPYYDRILSKLEKINEYAELKNQGLITESEFNKFKNDILKK